MNTRFSRKAIVLIALIPIFLFPCMPARAEDNQSLPAFSNFVTSVTNGQAGVVSGVYVPGVLADKVVQQAANNPAFVSPAAEVITQFNMAIRYGVIGLLAHNNLAGVNYSNLQVDQEVRIIYGDGAISYYTINSIDSFQALDSHSVTSSFADLDTNAIYSAAQLFAMYYQGGDHVTFQTCIYQYGNASWGRLFISATPGKPVQTVVTSTNVSHLLTQSK